MRKTQKKTEQNISARNFRTQSVLVGLEIIQSLKTAVSTVPKQSSERRKELFEPCLNQMKKKLNGRGNKKMKKEKGMTLQELTTRLQEFCHQGYSQHKVFVDINGYGVHLAEINDVKFKLNSSVTEDGYITVNMGGWKNYD